MDPQPGMQRPPPLTGSGIHGPLGGINTATVGLDEELRVRWVTPSAGAFFDLHAAAIGQPFANLTHHVAADHLLDAARTVRETHQPAEGAFHQRGVDWQVQLSPCYTTDGAPDGVVLTFIERPAPQHAKEVVALIDEERRRLGQDLHQLLASQLAGTAMVARALEEGISPDRPVRADNMRRMVDLIHAASGQARWLSHTLMPLPVRGDDLADRLRQFVEQETEMRLGVSITFSAEEGIPKLDDAAARHLYRIATDAIWNAAKRETVSTIQVRLATRGDQLAVSVQDDSGTIPADFTRAEQLGQHLLACRAAILGGSIGIDAVRGKHTRVQCHVDLESTLQDAAL